MTEQLTVTASDLYAKIVAGVVADSALETALLADFNGAVSQEFGVTLPSPGRLTRSASGFHLSYGGQDFDLGDPRTARPGELNDAELELVSGGTQDPCPRAQVDPNANRMAENATKF